MSKYMTKERFFPFVFGVSMTINFLIFWAAPVMSMGVLYKFLLKPYLQPIYLFMESNSVFRSFAMSFVYTKPEHADYFSLSLLLVLNCCFTIPFMFYWQLTNGSLPFWLIYAYYFSWVGIGGSMMGGAYALAHREGHNPRLYQKCIQSTVGNFFENVVGPFFGNIPWNFTSSHVKIHHAVNGGFGDSFYLWDFDRSSLGDYMLYVHRVFLHMIGYSSIRYFAASGRSDQAALLRSGVITYVTVGIAMLAITRSFSFLWWLYIEPLFCMTYFLSLLNIGFHGFLEFDEEGNHIPAVDSLMIIEGGDDVFGEDDHMSHHYHSGVYFKDLKAHQESKVDEFKKVHATVFRTLSVAEVSIFILLGLWDKLAEHYVDHTGELSREAIAAMLKIRAKRCEVTYERYEKYLQDPSSEARQQLRDVANKTNYLPAGCEADAVKAPAKTIDSKMAAAKGSTAGSTSERRSQ